MKNKKLVYFLSIIWMNLLTGHSNYQMSVRQILIIQNTLDYIKKLYTLNNLHHVSFVRKSKKTIDGFFNGYVFPARARVTLTSSTNSRGKKCRAVGGKMLFFEVIYPEINYKDKVTEVVFFFLFTFFLFLSFII